MPGDSGSAPVELVGLLAQVAACEVMLGELAVFEGSLCKGDAAGSFDAATLALCRSSLWQAAAVLSAELFRLKARHWELVQLQAVVSEVRDQLASGSGGGLFSMLTGMMGLGGGGRSGRAKSAQEGQEGD
jgi:hypothetical protein